MSEAVPNPESSLPQGQSPAPGSAAAPAAPATKSLSRPPTALELLTDRVFQKTTWVLALLSVCLVLLVIYEIGKQAMPALERFGFGLIASDDWDVSNDEFGILPHIWGTVYSSVLALILGTFFGVLLAIFITEDFLPPRWRTVLKSVVELLAAIPSVVYGLWGIFVVAPLIRGIVEWLNDGSAWLNGNVTDWVPVLSLNFQGTGMLPAALVLAIMILPTVSALSCDAIDTVPPRLREGAMGLGATRWEAILKVVLPTASTGILGAVILAFGRALGETMALAMLIGNSNTMSYSLLAPGNTLAALLANNFGEASGIQVAALMYAALVLMFITLLVNIIGSAVIWRASAAVRGLR